MHCHVATNLHRRFVVVLKSLSHGFRDCAMLTPPVIMVPQEQVGIPEPARPWVCQHDCLMIRLVYLLPSVNEVLLLG